ncbi:MAG: alanine racemase [Oceanicaulis sp.]
MTVDTLPTPCFVVDTGKLDANVARMAARAEALGVALRPHGKTPKCAEFGRKLANGAGLCTSTLLEAERYFAAGIKDLFYAVALSPAKAARAARLIADGAALTCLIDDPDGLAGIAAAARVADVRIPLLIEIAADDYRSGVGLEGPDLLRLAEAVAEQDRLDLVGVMSYGGASYTCRPEEAAALAERHRIALLEAAERLRGAGHAIKTLSFGSTPAVLYAAGLEGVTEIRCGIYAFQDLFQAAIGACAIEDIAGSVLTEVISRQPRNNRFVIDAGALALSKDRSTAATAFDSGFGRICDAASGALIGDLFVAFTSQELGLVTSLSGAPIPMDAFPVGRRLRVLPNHADMTAAAYDAYHLVNARGEVTGRLERFNGW